MRTIWLHAAKEEEMVTLQGRCRTPADGGISVASVGVCLVDGTPCVGWDASKKRRRVLHLHERSVGSVTVTSRGSAGFRFVVSVLKSKLPLSRRFAGCPFRLEARFLVRNRDGPKELRGHTECFLTKTKGKRQSPLIFDEVLPSLECDAAPLRKRRPPARRQALTREEVMAAFGAGELRQMAAELDQERQFSCEIRSDVVCGVKGY